MFAFLRRWFCNHEYRLSDMSNDGRSREWTCDKCGNVKVHVDLDPPKRKHGFAPPPVDELKKELCDCPGDEGSCAELPNCRFKAKG